MTCAPDRQGAAMSGVTEPQSSAHERRLTDAEADAFTMAHDTAFARMRTERVRLQLGVTAGKTMTVPGVTADNTDYSSLVTASGDIGESSTAYIEEISTYGQSTATWSSITQVVSGFARRVHLSSVGGYSQMVTGGSARIKTFSDTCGDALTDLFRQKCNLGSIYTDVDCYTTNGVIYLSSQHSAEWLTGPRKWAARRMIPSIAINRGLLPRSRSVAVPASTSARRWHSRPRPPMMLARRRQTCARHLLGRAPMQRLPA